MSSYINVELSKSANVKSQRALHISNPFAPLPLTHKGSGSDKNIFTETRPMLTPQAKPKELKFKFDTEDQKEKEEPNSKKKKTRKNRNKETNKANEENVDDDVEEKSVFLLNPSTMMKKPLQSTSANKLSSNKGIQVSINKNDSKLKLKELAAELSNEGVDVQLYTKRFEILQEFYDKMVTLVSDKVSPVRPDLPLYYQMVLDEATEELKEARKRKIKDGEKSKKYEKTPEKHEKKAKKKKKSSDRKEKSKDRYEGSSDRFEMYSDKIEKTPQKHKKSPNKHDKSHKKQEKDDKKLKKKTKQFKVEHSSKSNDSFGNEEEKSAELNLSLSMYKEHSIKEKKAMEDTIKNLNEKVEHLTQDLKYQMLAYTKIDNVRQKISDQLKEMKKNNKELEAKNQKYLYAINELK